MLNDETETTPDEFQVIETAAAAPAKRPRGRPRKTRTDVEPANAKPRSGSRAAARRSRYDSNLTAAIDGFGNPFRIELQKGWVAFWASPRDMRRHRRRKWVPGTWGDPRILSYDGSDIGKKGAQIKSPEDSLYLYLMRETDHAELIAADPYRQQHNLLKEDLFRRADESEAGGKRGYARFTQTEVTI
jgi:hypothetical protein